MVSGGPHHLCGITVRWKDLRSPPKASIEGNVFIYGFYVKETGNGRTSFRALQDNDVCESRQKIPVTLKWKSDSPSDALLWLGIPRRSYSSRHRTHNLAAHFPVDDALNTSFNPPCGDTTHSAGASRTLTF